MAAGAAFFAAAVRTPMGRAGGQLASVRPDDLAAEVVGALLARVPALEGARVDEVVWGAANQAGEDNRNVARMAALLAGLPVEVPGATVNRLCGSGLEAVASASRLVALGEADAHADLADSQSDHLVPPVRCAMYPIALISTSDYTAH